MLVTLCRPQVGDPSEAELPELQEMAKTDEFRIYCMKVHAFRYASHGVFLRYLLVSSRKLRGSHATARCCRSQVLPCSKRFCHDWATCSFAHPSECLALLCLDIPKILEPPEA